MPEAGKAALVVVRSEWFQDLWVRHLLGPTDSGRGPTDTSVRSNSIVCAVNDFENPFGLWTTLYESKAQLSPLGGKPFEFLIPWSAILTIAVLPIHRPTEAAGGATPPDTPDSGVQADLEELEKLYGKLSDEPPLPPIVRPEPSEET